MQEKYKFEDAAWFMDMKCLHELEAGLSRFGCRIGQAHPFYIATEKSYVNTKEYEIKIFIDNELEQFRGDKRFKEAFLFDNVPKDEIGIILWIYMWEKIRRRKKVYAEMRIKLNRIQVIKYNDNIYNMKEVGQ